jgi:ubiquinone/menaquinone biosynthesis C-methylase UbiE
MANHDVTSRPVGAVLHSPRLYDALLWLAFGGRERQFRRRLLDIAGLRLGESVLDLGAGTGTLAILAKRAVGRSGTVCGVDPSPEMVARARSKAARARAQIRFENAAAQALPFADRSFDLALSTMMLHHLGRAARRELAAELRRVVRPGGRVLIVDFARSAPKGGGFGRHFRHRHGHVDPSEIAGLLEEAGFPSIESGAVGVKDMHFVLARSPAPADLHSSQLEQPDGRHSTGCA